ncbi:MAG: dynamin family protein [Sulfuricellaceae bacterium]|nr:dynamin family protein [Sulfuricellaceae bacterium]
MTAQLLNEVENFRHWRENLITAINAYQAWLVRTGTAEPQQTQRIIDLVETLRKDRLILAFVAEFSRGKTELINALFFSDFKQRLLPSDVGRTTMCPTEIFYEPSDPPYIRLLPIETRFREESIASLKRLTGEWKELPLDIDSHEKMVAAMRSVAQKKSVPIQDAKALGLWDDNDPDLKDMVNANGTVDIPAWRHALINYPHPLLKDGLVILDTPGLNALGTEPELTLSMIPSAHAVLFLLAMDTGVTKSDMVIWHKYIQKFVTHRLAVLNKADILWDDLKPWHEISTSIHRQVEATAQLLELPFVNVLAISAQKALLAKIRGDRALLEKSGIGSVEAMLAENIVPAKQQILRSSVTKEIGGMVGASEHALNNELSAVRHELKELTALTGKNRDVVRKLLDKAQADKMFYEQTVKSFNITRGVISQQGKALLASLGQAKLDEILDKSRNSIERSWTTTGLLRSMQSLFGNATQQFDKIHHHAGQIKGLVDAAYRRFHEQHGFAELSPPALSLAAPLQGLQGLAQQTTDFCNDPVNIMTEKSFLVRKFYGGLVTAAEAIFEQAQAESETWLRASLTPLMSQIRDYKSQIERRIETVKQIHDNIDNLELRIDDLIARQADLLKQREIIEEILAQIGAHPPMGRNT